MKHTYPFQKYKELLTINHELDGLSFSKDDSREYILSKLEERSNKKREISNIANTIISEYIDPFEKNIDLLTKEDAEELREFSSEWVLQKCEY